jgi:predicted anti-sigma-YlaC factor YlaD
MDCTFIRDNLFEIAEGTLPSEEQASVTQHIRVCAGCRHLVTSFGSIEDTIHTTKSVEPDPFISIRIIAQIESRYFKTSENPHFMNRLFLRPALLGLVLGTAVLAGILFGRFGITRHNQISQEKELESLRSELYIDALADEDIHLISNP